MVEHQPLDSGDCYFVLRPNGALGWTEMQRLFIALAICIGAVAAYFVSLGAWLVLPFAGLEAGALAIGIYLSARWSATQEVITLRGSDLIISHGRRRAATTARLPRHWTRVVLSRDPNGWYASRLLLRCHGRHIEIGGCLVEHEREQLAQDLCARLSFCYTPHFAESTPLPEGLGAAEQKI